MLIEEHNEITQRILEIVPNEHQETALDLLTTLTEDYSEITGNVAKLENDVVDLRKSNAKLFLKIGQPQEKKEETTQEEKTPNFDDLFNEKGELI